MTNNANKDIVEKKYTIKKRRLWFLIGTVIASFSAVISVIIFQTFIGLYILFGLVLLMVIIGKILKFIYGID